MTLVDVGNRVVVGNVSADAQGSFRFNVKPGLYDILIFKRQYANTWTKGIRVGEVNVRHARSSLPRQDRLHPVQRTTAPGLRASS